MLERELQIKELEIRIDRMLDSENADNNTLDLLLDELEELLSDKYHGLRIVE